MDYKKVYDRLILKRQLQPLKKSQCYCECHHIVPKCLGGSDDSRNLVNLTAREHYIAHLLLAKVYNNLSLISAVIFMQCKSKDHKREFKFNSRIYESIKVEFSKMMSVNMKGRYVGTHLSEEHKHKISESNKGKHSNHSKQFLENLSKRMKDNKIWLGKHHTPESKAKISAIHKGKVISEKHKQRNRESMVGRVFWNNGTDCIRAKECPGEGWVLGRIYRGGYEGVYWWTNGKQNLRLSQCPGEGWRKGITRLLHRRNH